jgi:bifunctional N-acetylglucosamine-1-phosphate-uridyltransferase/glucosamine-1-phosphate-acetyltransferase GlmU-like protein
LFFKGLGNIGNNNIQKEYYLTDTIAYLVSIGFVIETEQITDSAQLLGVNTQEDLYLAEKIMMGKIRPF